MKIFDQALCIFPITYSGWVNPQHRLDLPSKDYKLKSSRSRPIIHIFFRKIPGGFGENF